jgi:hypothetical protein
MEPHHETSKYKPGDSVNCRVQAKEPGGYLVVLIPGLVQGFLPSSEPLDVGRIVSSTFVCMSGDKALLAYPTFAKSSPAKPMLASAAAAIDPFAVWADARPKTGERVQRAVDLFMPPMAALPTTKRLVPEETEKLIAKLDRDLFTGCLKVNSQIQRSRSAVIFYNGRAVGAIYGKKAMTEPYRIETSLLLMLEDMRHTPTEIEYYALPDEFILSLSALFLGVVIERPYGFKNKEYAVDVLKDFRLRKSTGCLSLQQNAPCGLGFVCGGKFNGAYSVEDRTYLPDETWLFSILDKFPGARLEAHVLPDILMSDAMLFGYNLTSVPFAVTT